MKALFLISTITLTQFSTIFAREVNPFEDSYVQNINASYKEASLNQEMKVSYLTKLLEHQQKAYEDKIAYLESELHKTKERLIEKSINQEKMAEAMKEKFNTDTMTLKKELAYKTKSLLEHQRQIEKMKPSEDLKNIIKLNTEMAAELRKSEDQIAIFQLKQIENIRGEPSAGRMPASAKEDN